MSAFGDPNPDAYTIDPGEGARGPRMGFQDAFMASLDVQRKVKSQLGLEQAFRDVEQAQIKKMRDAGLEPHHSLDEGDVPEARFDPEGGLFGNAGSAMRQIGAMTNQSRYSLAARTIVDGEGAGYVDNLVKERDEQIARLQAAHPELELKTYAQMFDEVRARAQETMKRASMPTSTMGAVGDFLGGMAGAVDPVTNPLNAATMPLGGGTGVWGRMLAQAGWQVGAEGLDILTNDNEYLLTGHKPTFGENAARIGLAAGGAMVGQGVVEGIGAGVRKIRTGKWFDDLPIDKLPTRERTPPEPTPELLPGERMKADRPLNEYPDYETWARSNNVEFERAYGSSREASMRQVLDIDYTARELNRWDGPAPHEIPARTDTALPSQVEPGVRYDQPYQRYVDRLETVDDVARRLDPELFGKYDKLSTERQALRDAIDRGRELGDLRPNADRPDRQAAYQRERAAVELELRDRIQQVDQQMRDLAPLVSRAYGMAEKEWRATPLDFNTLRYLRDLEQGTGWRYRGEDKPTLTERPPKIETVPMAASAQSRPTISLTPDQTARLRPGADVVDRAAIVVADNAAAVGEKVEQFVKQARAVAKLEVAEVRAKIAKLKEDIAGYERQRTMSDTASGRDSADETITKLKKKLDELEYATLPDGSKLHYDNDVLPGPDGKDVTVREYLREMDKDQHALDAVVTCSRPS